jgi:hypothetical protein
VCLFVSEDTHLVVDRAGSFAAGGGFEVVDRPVRIVDTRSGVGTAG